MYNTLCSKEKAALLPRLRFDAQLGVTQNEKSMLLLSCVAEMSFSSPKFYSGVTCRKCEALISGVINKIYLAGVEMKVLGCLIAQPNRWLGG